MDGSAIGNGLPVFGILVAAFRINILNKNNICESKSVHTRDVPSSDIVGMINSNVPPGVPKSVLT
jgi:hypothetical protein